MSDKNNNKQSLEVHFEVDGLKITADDDAYPWKSARRRALDGLRDRYATALDYRQLPCAVAGAQSRDFTAAEAKDRWALVPPHLFALWSLVALIIPLGISEARQRVINVSAEMSFLAVMLEHAGPRKRQQFMRL